MRVELPRSEFVVPSGIVAATPDIIQRVAECVDDVGVITTKSIGLSERDGYGEPIVAGVGGSLVNAVGLSNPGISEFLKELASTYPQVTKHGKILMTSIFGGTAGEFAELASVVEKHTDWIELNLSCPHAEGYGASVGTSPDLVSRVISAAREATDRPLFAKIVPSAGLSGIIAKVAVGSGADGITAVNTLGPLAFSDPLCGKPLVANIWGGLSGTALREVALRCTREVREAVGETVPIIGMGGIASPADVESFRRAGASLFGVGTALWGMSTSQMGGFFASLRRGRPVEASPPPLSYSRLRVKEAWGTAAGRVLVFDSAVKAAPGQFLSVWVPGVGEKPFSLALDDPMTLLVKGVGKVSTKIAMLEEGDEVMARGPYGNGYAPSGRVCLVGGGTGVAPLHFIARRHRGAVAAAFVGGRSREDLPLYDALCGLVETKASTEDGSLGHRGLVTEIVRLDGAKAQEFFNCGPEAMLVRAAAMEGKVADASRIFCAVERYAKCGIGLCGSCAMDGYRICVDGPVFAYSQLGAGKHFGCCKRTASGRIIKI